MPGDAERAGGQRRQPTERELARQRVFRRRRRTALAAGAFLLLLLVWGVSSLGGDDSDTAAEAPPELPRGGRTILPRHRVVSYYGAPQDAELGILGAVPTSEAAKRLVAQSRGYEHRVRPVLPAFELIATIARAEAGQDGLHRLRQTDTVIRRYLAAVRRIKGLLILDVQPGQASFIDEVRALEPYLLQADVGLALDSEWSVPSGTVPGEVIGSTDSGTINEVAAYLSQIVRARDLPQKLLVVHQFTEGMVEGRESVATYPGVAVVFNVDGFGTPELKEAVYHRLTGGDNAQSLRGRFSGFKLFYKEDSELMSPGSVLGLRPQPDVIVYE